MWNGTHCQVLFNFRTVKFRYGVPMLTIAVHVQCTCEVAWLSCAISTKCYKHICFSFWNIARIMNFLETPDINLLQWSTRTPDFSPIVHVWDMMEKTCIIYCSAINIGALRNQVQVVSINVAMIQRKLCEISDSNFYHFLLIVRPTNCDNMTNITELLIASTFYMTLSIIL